MATVRERAKAAVGRAKRDAASMWIDLQFNSTTAVAYEADNPSRKATEASETILGLEDKYTVFQIANVDGVQSGDRRFYIDPDDLTSDISIIDSVTIDGVKYRMESYTPIQQDVLIEVQLRRGG